MDREGVMPLSRTAILARELQHYNLDMAAWVKPGLWRKAQLLSKWKVRQRSDRIPRVGLAITTPLLHQLPHLPTCINESLFKLCSPSTPLDTSQSSVFMYTLR